MTLDFGVPKLAQRLGKPSHIDNTTFRMHYRTTFTILVLCSILTTSFQYFGSAIQCMGKGGGGLVNTYCWIQGTFTLPAKLAGTVGQDMPHPGVGPSSDPNLIRVEEGGDEVRHAWYQWVCFVLAFQALLFYVPHWIWKHAEGGKINLLTKDMDDSKTLFEPEGKDDKRRACVHYFVRTMNTHNKYVTKFVICEVLNFINVLFQIYFMDMFLNGQFSQYGLDVLRTSELPMEERVDPMAKVKLI